MKRNVDDASTEPMLIKVEYVVFVKCSVCIPGSWVNVLFSVDKKVYVGR
jgi:hypothetical protein